MYKRPLVYIFRRGREVLYVGKGASISRPFKNTHSATFDLGSDPNDTLEIIPYETDMEAFVAETKFIRSLKPKRNIQKRPRAEVRLSIVRSSEAERMTHILKGINSALRKVVRTMVSSGITHEHPRLIIPSELGIKQKARRSESPEGRIERVMGKVEKRNDPHRGTFRVLRMPRTGVPYVLPFGPDKT